jgi:hypothetical protein
MQNAPTPNPAARPRCPGCQSQVSPSTDTSRVSALQGYAVVTARCQFTARGASRRCGLPFAVVIHPAGTSYEFAPVRTPTFDALLERVQAQYGDLCPA